jgi:hypothetical protein
MLAVAVALVREPQAQLLERRRIQGGGRESMPVTGDSGAYHASIMPDQSDERLRETAT